MTGIPERFREIRELGRGGYGRVLLVHDRDRGGEVVLKLPLRDDEECTRRFKREIEEQKRAAHSHIMPILDHDARLRWLTMPRAVESLEEAAAGLSDDEISTMMRQAAAGLGHAHSLGIVHRDVTPGNLLALEPRKWVVGDFGLVRRPPGHKTSFKTEGTPGTAGFIAPEVLGQPQNATQAADVYSLGRTLGWVTSGQRPEQGKPSFARGAWLPLVTQMTETNADDRLPSMGAVLEELRSVETALRKERRGRWGNRPSCIALSPLEQAVLWAFLEAGYEPEETDHAAAASRWNISREVRGYSSAEVWSALLNLDERGLVTQIRVETDDGAVRNWALTPAGTAWLRAQAPHQATQTVEAAANVEDDIPF